MQKNIPFNPALSGGCKTIIVLCVDISNSMHKKETVLNKSIRAFLSEIDKDVHSQYCTEVAVVTYDEKPHDFVDFTTKKSDIPEIKIPNPKKRDDGWSDIGKALSYSIDKARTEWALQRNNGMAYLPWVILFTDGIPENSDNSANKNMQMAIDKLRSLEIPQQNTDKVHFIGIGVGKKVNQELMKRISVYGESRYKHASDFSDLSKVFKFVGATTVTNKRADFDDIDRSYGSGFTVEPVTSPVTQHVPENKVQQQQTVSESDTISSDFDTSEDFFDDVYSSFDDSQHPARTEKYNSLPFMSLDSHQNDPPNRIDIEEALKESIGRSIVDSDSDKIEDWIIWDYGDDK